MPEGFNKVSDLKIVISAATGPLQDGIKDAQALIRSFNTDASSGLGMLDGVLGKVGGSMGALAGRLNVVVGALSAAGAVIQQVGALGERVADNVGAGKEFDTLQASLGEVQSALLDLAGIAFQALQKEAAQAAVSLMGFEAATASADATAENFAQRALRRAAEKTEDFAQRIRELAPIDMQSYNTLATSLDRINERIEAIEESMVSGKQEATNWWDALKGILAEYAEFDRSWGTGPQDQLAVLKAQRDVIAEIVSAEKARWAATPSTPDADRFFASLEREIQLIEAKSAALNMGAAAAATYMMRERLRLDLEQQTFALTPDGEESLEKLITGFTEAQKKLEAGQETKRQAQIHENREKTIENVFNNMALELANEELRARTVGLSADETRRLTIEETALLQIRLAGREPTEKEIQRARENAAARVAAARATADLSDQLQLLQDHARIAGRALESGFSGWIRGTEISWQSMISRMLEDMAMLSARKLVFEPLFGGSSKPGDTGGLFGEVLTSLFGGAIGYGGQREAGGPVSPGMAYVVGERRPELFIPHSPGTIVPDLFGLASMALAPPRQRTGGDVHIQTTIDARGATPDAVAGLRTLMMQRDAELPGQILSVVGEAQDRGILG